MILARGQQFQERPNDFKLKVNLPALMERYIWHLI